MLVRHPPDDLSTRTIEAALEDSWGISGASAEYLPEGGGSHHWRVTDETAQVHFVTVDDLDAKDWIGQERDLVFDGLAQALATAHALRHDAGLRFVVPPVAAGDGSLVCRLTDRYAVSVYPWLSGRSHGFGSFLDPALRDDALGRLAELHRATGVVRDVAPTHVLGYAGRQELELFLADPQSAWRGGPYAEPARELFLAHAAALAELVSRFDRVVLRTEAARSVTVITHGEPHPGNLMVVGGTIRLIDWDTAGLAPPERDIALVAAAPCEGIERYEQATGHEVDFEVVALYRARWYLDDMASSVRLFGASHAETPDTQRWFEGVGPQLAELGEWIDLLG